MWYCMAVKHGLSPSERSRGLGCSRRKCLESLPQPLSNCDNGCKMLRTIYRRMTFGIFMTVCMREYTPALLSEWCILCIDVTVWAHLTLTCVSFGLNCPPLWARWQHARLSRSGPGFDPRSGQVSWVRFFRGFSSL